MTYQVEGDTLVADQPSRQGEQRTSFRLARDGWLYLSRYAALSPRRG